jgi:hypothetical protein
LLLDFEIYCVGPTLQLVLLYSGLCFCDFCHFC